MAEEAAREQSSIALGGKGKGKEKEGSIKEV